MNKFHFPLNVQVGDTIHAEARIERWRNKVFEFTVTSPRIFNSDAELAEFIWSARVVEINDGIPVYESCPLLLGWSVLKKDDHNGPN